jgi:hypothetical protein
VRKKSKYKPRGVILDPVGWIKQGFTPISEHGSSLVTMRLRNHSALSSLGAGTGTAADFNLLIAAVNMTEALYRMGVGRDYNAQVKAGLAALRSVGRRFGGVVFACEGQEMDDLNEVMDLHDAQLEVINVQQMEKAMRIVSSEIRNKRATPIVGDGVDMPRELV